MIYWADNVTAYAHGGENKSNAVSAALALFHSRSLSTGKPRLFEQAVSSLELELTAMWMTTTTSK